MILRREKGSLTIEASLAVPVFMFAVFMVMSVINLMRFHLNLQEAVHQEASRLSLYAYDKWEVSEGSVKSAILGRMDDSVKDKAPVKGGVDAIDLCLSRLDDREIIEINASYDAQLPYDLSGIFNKRFTARCLMHTYIGYEKGLADVSDRLKDEEYVYVTETGTVYHRDRECTYLRLSIKKVSRDSVKDLRNSNGHKYYPCEKCGKRAGSTVYITKDGTCYHGSLDCSGLKRTIHCIPLSKVGGRGPCSRCSR
ncbi:MAG: pilus assembly protein [Lachnospiraceae bacterium]|nr:pilus assembly protein [Lachnospiraceae bacterium]